MNSKSNQGWRCCAIGLAFAMLAGGCQTRLADSRRRGEIDVIKAVPDPHNLQTLIRPKALLLRGHGVSVTESFGTITGPLDDARLITGSRLLSFAASLREAIERSITTLEYGSATNDPRYLGLTAMRDRIGVIQTRVLATISGTDAHRERLLQQLERHRNYLSRLQSDMIYLQSLSLKAGNGIGQAFSSDANIIPRDLLVEVFGQPVAYGEFTSASIQSHLEQFEREMAANGVTDWHALKERLRTDVDLSDQQPLFRRVLVPRIKCSFLLDLNPALVHGDFDQAIENDYSDGLRQKLPQDQRIYFLEPDGFRRRFGAMLLDTGLLPLTAFSDGFLMRPTVSDDGAASKLLNHCADLQASLFVVCENVFNINEALNRGSHNGFCAWDFHSHQPKFYPWRIGLERFIKQIESALRSTDNVFEALAGQMKDDIRLLTPLRVELEVMARHYSSLTGKAFNRQLRQPAGQDAKPLLVTLILKQLFLKHLGDPLFDSSQNRSARPSASATTYRRRHGDLLVVCRFTTAENESAAYPIIFQENFLPNHFVNIKDRIVHGPSPYTGGFSDVSLSILRAASDDAGIKAGFQGIVSTIGIMNPEFAAISPAVSALFNGILDVANREQLEFEIQWTIPAEDDPNSANTDGLLAETGIYIAIKSEEPEREGISPASGRRLDPSQLVYDPESVKLYWRRSFSDPKKNFTPDNEFREKSYAIFALVDDYQREDQLGTILRNQVKAVVDKDQAERAIPEPRELASSFGQLFAAGKSLLGDGKSDISISNRLSVLKSLQAKLWQTQSPYERNMIVTLLSGLTDSSVSTVLGDDIERWKRATFKLDGTNGIILDPANDSNSGATPEPASEGSDGVAPSTGEQGVPSQN